VANLAAGIAKHYLTEKEVKDTANAIKDKFEKLLLNLIPRMIKEDDN